MIRSVLRGNYNSKSPVSCYSRTDLFRIVDAVEQSLCRVRSGISDSESETILDIILLLICNKEDYNNVKFVWS